MSQYQVTNSGVVYSMPGTNAADGSVTEVPIPKWQHDSLTIFGKEVELNSSSSRCGNPRRLNLSSTFRCIVKLWIVCLIIAMLLTIFMVPLSIISPDCLPDKNSEANSTTGTSSQSGDGGAPIASKATPLPPSNSDSDAAWYNSRESSIGLFALLTLLGHCFGFVGTYKLSIPWTTVCCIWIICFPLVGMKFGLLNYVLGINVLAVFLGGTSFIWNLACYAKVRSSIE